MSRGSAPRSPCLGPAIGDYVDGVLPPHAQLAAERHLVVCVPCRHAVETEQRMIASLRGSSPSIPGGLQAMLLSMGSPTGPDADREDVPGVPVAPVAVRQMVASMSVVPVVAADAPAQHRSALRSAVCASLAAGASAAAALSLGIVGVPAAPVSPALSGGSGVPGASYRSTPVGSFARSGRLGSPAVLTSVSVPTRVVIRPAVSEGSPSSAQSRP